MATPSYTTDLTVLDDAADDTGWAEATASGWTSVFAVTSGETDYFIQGTACNSTTAKTGVGALLYNNGSGVSIDANGAFLIWVYWTSPNSLASEANGGIRTVCGNSLGDFYGWAHYGSDSYIYGGWLNLATNPAATVPRTYTAGSPSGTWQYFGAAFNATTVPSKGNPFGVDEVSYGRCEFRVNGGQAADYATFTGMGTTNDYNDGSNGYNRWGLFQTIPGGFLWKGLITLGYSSLVDFRDSNTLVLIEDTKHVTSAFNSIDIKNANSRVDWTSIAFQALGTVSKGTLTVVDNADVNIDSCSFTDMNTFTFLSNSSVTDSIFRRCALVTHGGSVMNGSSILESTVAADIGALYYNQAVDPDGEMDGMTFTKGTNAHHAIRFGANIPASITLRNCTFNGFSSSDDANGSVFRFDDTSGNITLNLVGCATDGSFSVDDAAGCTVTVVINPVTTLVHVDDDDGNNEQGVRVLLEASSNAGDFPYEESVTITRVTTTASVSHTAHGLSNNDYVVIRGANQPEYNGPHQISNVSTNAYDYTVSGTPATPATGTIISSGAILSGTTDSSGNISQSRTFTLDQPVKGVARLSSSSPRFKSFPLSGTIDNADGLTINVRLVLDE